MNGEQRESPAGNNTNQRSQSSHTCTSRNQQPAHVHDDGSCSCRKIPTESVRIIQVKQHDLNRKVFLSTSSSPGSNDKVDFSLSFIIPETHNKNSRAAGYQPNLISTQATLNNLTEDTNKRTHGREISSYREITEINNAPQTSS